MLDLQVIRKIATLAHIYFSPEEEITLQKELTIILHYFSSLEEMTSNLHMTDLHTQSTIMSQYLESLSPTLPDYHHHTYTVHLSKSDMSLPIIRHQDIIQKGLDKRTVLSGSPRTNTDFFIVPKVIVESK